MRISARSTIQYNTTQHKTTQHSTAQHSTAQHSTAQHSTAQHSTAHRIIIVKEFECLHNLLFRVALALPKMHAFGDMVRVANDVKTNHFLRHDRQEVVEVDLICGDVT